MDMNRAAMFVHVVEAQGFTAAARKLAIPKTTVSKKVSDLEAELGIRLLNRTTRSLSLTEGGQRVYSHCVQAIRHMEAAQREAQALQLRPEGMLRLAAPSGVINSTLIPLLTDFMAVYPDIRVTMLSVSAPVRLDEDQIDALIWVTDLPGAAHTRRFVAEVEMGLYASAGYIAQHGVPRRPQDLAQHRAIAFTQALHHDQFIWHLQRGNQEIDIVPEKQPRFVGDDAVPIFAAAVAGLGIAVLPIRYVQNCGQEMALVPVLPAWLAPALSLSAYFLDGQSASLKTRLFIDHAAAWIKRLG